MATQAQIIAKANDRVREWLSRRIDADSLDIARLYKGSRDRLMMKLRGLYDSYLAEEPTYVRARQTGTLTQMQKTIDMELDTLTDEVGQRAVAKTAEILNIQSNILDKQLGRHFARKAFEDLPISTRQVLGELTTNMVGGATFEDRLFHASDLFKRDLHNGLRRGLITGKSFDDIRKDMMKSFGVDKLGEPKYNAYGSVKIYKNEARRQWNMLMKKQGERGEGKQVWWAMVDDPDVTPGCLARHGMDIDEDLDGDVPPRHYNCRCTVAVFPAGFDLSQERVMATARLKRLGYTRRDAMFEESWDPSQHPRDDDGKFSGGGGSSPEDAKAWADDAGGKFDGIQERPRGQEPLVLITDKKTGSTGGIPLSQLTKASVKAKVDEIRGRTKEVGWGWGHEILQPIARITDDSHRSGYSYRSVHWRALPREAAGLVLDARWFSSLRAGVSGDTPDRVLLRTNGKVTEVKSWRGWTPLDPRGVMIETAQGIVDDSAVIQPPWDLTVQRLPLDVRQRWPMLARLSVPVQMEYVLALVSKHDAEQLTIGIRTLQLGEYMVGEELGPTLARLLWQTGHPAEPHLVIATSELALRIIVNITTGEVIYATDNFASPLCSPYTRVAAAVLERDGRIWAIMPRGLARWVLPGGHIDAGESPRDAVVREMLEETGQHIRVERLLGTLYRPWSNTLIFLCRNITKHRAWYPSAETDAVMQVNWTDLALDERLFLERHGITAKWTEAGTSIGAKKGWDTRGRGRKEDPSNGHSRNDVQVDKRFNSVHAKAIDDALATYPPEAVAGLKIRLDKSAGERGGAYHLAGVIHVDPSRFSSGIISARDLDGNRMSKSGEKSMAGEHEVPDVGAHILQQTIQHEIGHYVDRQIPEVLRSQADKVFGGKTWKVKTPVTARYEFGDKHPMPGINFHRQRSEQFADAVRLKVANPLAYKKLPSDVRDVIDVALKRSR